MVEKTMDAKQLNQDAFEPVEQQEGPGNHLRKARELKGMTEEDIAMRLRLRTSLVIDIDNDNLDAFQEPVFVRGYLRAYAKLVDINGDEVIAAYNARFPEKIKPSQRPLWQSRTLSEDAKPRAWGKLAAVGFFFAVLLAFFWGYSQYRLHRPLSTQIGDAGLTSHIKLSDISALHTPKDKDIASGQKSSELSAKTHEIS